MVFRYLFFASVLALAACDKQDCNSKNEHTDYYSVEDSVLIPISQEWLHQSYELKMITCEKNDEWLRIFNISSEQFVVSGSLSDSAFSVCESDVSHDAWRRMTVEGIRTSNEVRFEYASTNAFGEVFIGRGSGIKQ